MKYVCTVCGWEYDESAGYPEGGIAPGTPWSEVPEDFEYSFYQVVTQERQTAQSAYPCGMDKL